MKRNAFRFLLPLLLLLILVPGCKKRNVLLTVPNEDGSMRVEIAEVGDPEFPYGPTHCSVRLYRNNTLVKEERFEIKNDGKHASEENFSVFWERDEAAIAVHAEEEEDRTIHLPFE